MKIQFPEGCTCRRRDIGRFTPQWNLHVRQLYSPSRMTRVPARWTIFGTGPIYACVHGLPRYTTLTSDVRPVSSLGTTHLYVIFHWSVSNSFTKILLYYAPVHTIHAPIHKPQKAPVARPAQRMDSISEYCL